MSWTKHLARNLITWEILDEKGVLVACVYDDKLAERITRLPELEADAALGRAVRRIAIDHSLVHYLCGWYCVEENNYGSIGEGDTPEAALKAAGLMEEE